MPIVFTLKFRNFYFAFRKFVNLLNLLYVQNVCVCAFFYKKIPQFLPFPHRNLWYPLKKRLSTTRVLYVKKKKKKHIHITLKSNIERQRSSLLPSKKKKKKANQAFTGGESKKRRNTSIINRNRNRIFCSTKGYIVSRSVMSKSLQSHGL